jgi:transcriptional regulator with XRE-family HTH domain
MTEGRLSPGRVTLRELVARHRTQAEAAKAWGVSQPAISRLMRGERGSGNSDSLRSIAECEGVDISQIVLDRPDLQIYKSGVTAGQRFVYEPTDPGFMLEQLEDWFADFPGETRLRRQAVRAVMRTLFDESFDAIHPPTAEWDAVMQHLYFLPRGHTKSLSTRARK